MCPPARIGDARCHPDCLPSWAPVPRPPCTPAGTPGCWSRSRGALGRELGVAGRGQLSLQVLQDVERQTADHGDGRHFPHEGHGCDKGKVCRRHRNRCERRPRRPQALTARSRRPASSRHRQALQGPAHAGPQAVPATLSTRCHEFFEQNKRDQSIRDRV